MQGAHKPDELSTALEYLMHHAAITPILSFEMYVQRFNLTIEAMGKSISCVSVCLSVCLSVHLPACLSHL